jgi:hypothetical protein
MQTLLLSILLSLFSPPQQLKPDVEISFNFDHSALGKPTLSMYYYDINIKNKSTSAVYVGIPKWFGGQIERIDKISGAQYDSFGKTTGSTLFCGASFTIFKIEPDQKIYIEDFRIETFDEKIPDQKTTQLNYVLFSKINIDTYTLLEFMEKKELHGSELEYVLSLAYTEEVELKVKK